VSILIPSDNLTPTDDSPIVWHRSTGTGFWWGHTAAAIDYHIDRAPSATYRVWVSINGHSEPLRAFPTTAEAAAYAVEHYLASL